MSYFGKENCNIFLSLQSNLKMDDDHIEEKLNLRYRNELDWKYLLIKLLEITIELVLSCIEQYCIYHGRA